MIFLHFLIFKISYINIQLIRNSRKLLFIDYPLEKEYKQSYKNGWVKNPPKSSEKLGKNNSPVSRGRHSGSNVVNSNNFTKKYLYYWTK